MIRASIGIALRNIKKTMNDLLIQDLTLRPLVEGGYTMREIGEYLGMHYSSISLALRKCEKSQYPTCHFKT